MAPSRGKNKGDQRDHRDQREREERGDRRRGDPRPDAAAEAVDRQAFIPDLFRRALALGLSGIFTTEEAFRRALGDTLPKDWVDFAVDQSDRTRTEFVNRLAGEMARVLEAMDLEGMTRSMLADHKIEVKAEIRLVADSERDTRSEQESGKKKKTRGGEGAAVRSVSVVGSGGKST